MTLKFNKIRAVVKVHVRAKFHRVKCSGSLVIALTEKKRKHKIKKSDDGENNTVVTLQRTVIKHAKATATVK